MLVNTTSTFFSPLIKAAEVKGREARERREASSEIKEEI